MNKLADQQQDDNQQRAMSAAIAAVRRIVAEYEPLTLARLEELGDTEWGWIITAAIFGWHEGRERVMPSLNDVAVVRSILSKLADTARIDWSLSLKDWSEDTMINFLLLAQQLMKNAEGVEYPVNWEKADPIPFDP
jgi:hypothetical protein